jgi:hypothetical protein
MNSTKEQDQIITANRQLRSATKSQYLRRNIFETVLNDDFAQVYFSLGNKFQPNWKQGNVT